MTDTALAPDRSTQDDQKRQARRFKALEQIFGGKFIHTFASPYLLMEDHLIESPVALRFYRKDFAYLSKQLYLEYQFRSWKGFNPDLLARYADVTSAKLVNINTLMSNTVSRLKKLLETQGHKDDLPLWPSVHRVDVPIIASHARSYINMLTQLDRVYALAGTANLLGVIDSTQRAEAEYVCKKAVRAFRSILQTEVVKLYREAERIIHDQHSTGQVDPAMANLVQQQGQDIADFDKTSQEDDAGDNGMDLKGADAGQVIDDSAAASTAAAAAAAKKRPKAPAKVDAPPVAETVAAGAAAS